MQPFGRLGYALIRQKFGATWREKAVKSIFVGFAKNHSPDVYLMYNP
jgi:hypothetical protein